MSNANPQDPPLSEVRVGAEAPERILAAAEVLFAEHGFDAASMHAIAAHAGVSKANIFHHFSSKHDLYLAVLSNACRDAAERLQHFDEAESAFAERFAAYGAGMLRGMLERERVHRLIQRELLKEDNGVGAKEIAERVFGDRFGRLVAILRSGQGRGELRADVDPAMAAIALIGANVFFMQSRNVFKHFPDVGFAADPAQYSALLTNILLHGILARPPQQEPT
jgi:TetR/AcrR family transcriptional regulator